MFLSSDLCKLAHHSLRPAKYSSCQSAVSLASRSFFCTTAVMTMQTEFTHISFKLRVGQRPSMSTDLRATCFLCLLSYAITNSLFTHLSRSNTYYSYKTQLLLLQRPSYGKVGIPANTQSSWFPSRYPLTIIITMTLIHHKLWLQTLHN